MSATEPEQLTGVTPVWESDRYDMALKGHAWYNGDYGVFEVWDDAPDPPVYSLSRAKSPETALRLMARRQLFEDLVGHHCTYRTRGFYDPEKAIGFDSFYGRAGTALHPYVAAAKNEQPDELEFVGVFTFGGVAR